MGAKARLGGQYFRGSVSWVRPLHESGAFNTRQCVMLLLMANLEFDGHGNATAWCPRSEMAEKMGVSEVAVKRSVSRLIDAGVLKVRTPGHNGKATVYYVLPGYPWPTMSLDKGVPGTSRRGTQIGPEGVPSQVPPSLLTSEGVRDRASARPAPPDATTF